MFAILAEDDSDADSLACIIKRHLRNDRLTIKRKGYGGAGGLCSKGARDIRAWLTRGVARFVVCLDADSNPPLEVREKILTAVVVPAGVRESCCITVPVREFEAWLIADPSAITKTIPTIRPRDHTNPESIADPKEWIVRESIAANGRPLYVPKIFNPRVSQHIRFDVVAKKCPSFRAFLECLSERCSG